MSTSVTCVKFKTDHIEKHWIRTIYRQMLKANVKNLVVPNGDFLGNDPLSLPLYLFRSLVRNNPFHFIHAITHNCKQILNWKLMASLRYLWSHVTKMKPNFFLKLNMYVAAPVENFRTTLPFLGEYNVPSSQRVGKIPFC